MKNIHLENGGFPLTTKTIKHLSEMTKQVAEVVAHLAGYDKVIISGVEENNGQISNGWVVIGGELYPFIGGAIQSHVRIQENIEQAQYLKDENNDGIGDFVDAYFNRFAVLTPYYSSGINIALADFVRYEDISTSVLKSGVIEIDPSNQTGSVISGDFTLVEFDEITTVTVVSNLFQCYGIQFESVNQDYDVVINQKGTYNGNLDGSFFAFVKVYTAIINKQNDKLNLSLRSTDNSLLSDTTSKFRFEITLINK